MIYFIPILSGFLYRAGGADWGNKWYRWLLGVPIALITRNGLFIITYYIATAIFVYGDKSIFSKWFGRKGARIIHGIAFGLASLQPIFIIWTTIIFYILFELAENNIIDNKWAERGRGFFGTIIFVWH